MKHKQLFLVILAFLMTGASIVLLNSSQVIGAMVVSLSDGCRSLHRLRFEGHREGYRHPPCWELRCS